MKRITNPNNGADIIERNIGGSLFTVKKGESIEVSDSVGDLLLEFYGFLSGRTIETHVAEKKEEAPKQESSVKEDVETKVEPVIQTAKPKVEVKKKVTKK